MDKMLPFARAADELEKLAKLRNEGVLSANEYESLKAAFIKSVAEELPSTKAISRKRPINKTELNTPANYIITQRIDTPVPKRSTATDIEPTSKIVGWKKTFQLVGLLSASIFLISLALYVPTNNQILQIGVWIAFLISSILTVGTCVDLLESYSVKFLSLPSTWLMFLNLILMWAFVSYFGSNFLDLVRGASWAHQLNSTGTLLLAGMILLIVASFISNIGQTNVLFGILLTIFQFVFSIILIVAFFLIASTFGAKNKRRR
jgi:hypothetical protein